MTTCPDNFPREHDCPPHSRLAQSPSHRQSPSQLLPKELATVSTDDVLWRPEDEGQTLCTRIPRHSIYEEALKSCDLTYSVVVGFVVSMQHPYNTILIIFLVQKDHIIIHEKLSETLKEEIINKTVRLIDNQNVVRIVLQALQLPEHMNTKSSTIGNSDYNQPDSSYINYDDENDGDNTSSENSNDDNMSATSAESHTSLASAEKWPATKEIYRSPPHSALRAEAPMGCNNPALMVSTTYYPVNLNMRNANVCS